MIEHLLCHDGLMKSEIEGEAESYIVRGRPRMEHINLIMVDTGKDRNNELK